VRRYGSVQDWLAAPVQLDRDPLDVALESGDAEILRTEDVQAGRRGPAWTS